MPHQAIRYDLRSTATAGGLAAAATSVAAATLAASILFSPAAEASSRLQGVHEDLVRAVELNQITEEQAVKFESKIAGRILGES